MINTRDVSRELAPFAKSFNSFCRDGYRYDGGEVFADLLDYGLEGFKVKTNPEICRRLREKYKEDEEGLRSLFVELAKLYGANVGEGWRWFDALGNIYEAIASGYKKSSFGQFFTPEHICDMMGKMVVSREDKEVTISDPCSGSGRLLLAGYCSAQGKAVLYGEDKDAICAKMTALNFLFHGCRAEVVCHDSLLPDTFNFGYHIQPYKELSPLPHLIEITAEESVIVCRARAIKEEKPEQFKAEVEFRKELVQRAGRGGEQLGLF